MLDGGDVGGCSRSSCGNEAEAVDEKSSVHCQQLKSINIKPTSGSAGVTAAKPFGQRLMC